MAQTKRKKVPMTYTGADKLVVVLKLGNASGAKGLGVLALNEVQLERERHLG